MDDTMGNPHPFRRTTGVIYHNSADIFCIGDVGTVDFDTLYPRITVVRALKDEIIVINGRTCRKKE
jgi:hypothetical protein